MSKLLLFLLTFQVYLVTAQSKEKLFLSASLNPVITFANNTSSSSNKVQSADKKLSQTYADYTDSVKQFETFKVSVGATVWVNYSLSNKWNLQTGIGYNEVGFTREQKNIQYNEYWYPNIGTGKREDLSNAKHNISYRYRYQYLSVPVLFNYYKGKSKDYKWTYSITTGAGLSMLLKHQLKTELRDFIIDEKSIFQFDSTGFVARKWNVNLYLGARFDYKIDKQLGVFFQPLTTLYPLSAATGDIQSMLWGLQLNLGVNYYLGKDER